MDFINSPVDLQSLPAAEDLELKAIHPDYKKVLLTEWIIYTVSLSIIAALLIIFIPYVKTSMAWIIILGVVLFISGLQYLSITRSFPILGYALREKDVINRKGWLLRTVRICPFNRIQNCSVQTGPLERKYKLASLFIYTAGTEGADMRINGLTQEEADRLRYYILEKIHKETDETI